MRNGNAWNIGPTGVIVGIVLIFAVVLGVGALFAANRRKALQQLADILGFEFVPHLGLDFIRQFPTFQILTAGRSHMVSNLLSGSTDSTKVMIFDWRFVTGGGKNSATHNTTIVAIQSSKLDLSPFLLRPETVLDWLGLTFDGKDIDFEDRPLFSKKFHLHGNNEGQIRRLFDADVCEYFEQHLSASAEGSREWLLYYHNSQTIAPHKLQEHFKNAFSLFVLLCNRLQPASPDSPESEPTVSDQARDEMSSEPEREF